MSSVAASAPPPAANHPSKRTSRAPVVTLVKALGPERGKRRRRRRVCKCNMWHPVSKSPSALDWPHVAR
eukprot:5834606-Prymnesium_polylepis.2